MKAVEALSDKQGLTSRSYRFGTQLELPFLTPLGAQELQEVTFDLGWVEV